MKRAAATAAIATTLGLMSAPAVFAGALETPVVEPAPVIETQPAFAGGAWDGFYGGAQLGYGWFDAEDGGVDADGDDALGGLHAGWQTSTNQIVYGVEADYNYGELELGSDELNSLSHIKAKLGYDMGRALPYVTAGGAYGDFEDAGGEWGYAAGLGVDYMVTDRVSLGAEALYQSFEDVDGGDTDIDGTTLSAKVAYHF